MRVIITVGNGIELHIDDDNHLRLSQTTHVGSTVDLGLATKERFEEIQNHLRRLAVHAVPDPAVPGLSHGLR